MRHFPRILTRTWHLFRGQLHRLGLLGCGARGCEADLISHMSIQVAKHSVATRSNRQSWIQMSLVRGRP
jgi:hypothetical protein